MTTNVSGNNLGSFANQLPGPTAGELVTAGSIRLLQQGAADQDKYIYDTKLALSGGTMTGTLALARTRIPAQKDLGDTDHTLYDSITDGLNHIRMLTAPAANRDIKLPQPTAWAPTTAYNTTNPDFVSNDGGKLYECITNGTSAGSGGPTGTAADITDGTAHWKYVGLSPVNGDWYNLAVFVSSSAFSVQVKRSTSAEYLAFLGPGADSGDMATALFRYNGTKWKLIDVGGSAAEFGDESSDP